MQPVHRVWVDHVPVLWVEPSRPDPTPTLALFLPRFGSDKEAVVPFLRDLAGAGFLAMSFDPWQHGGRGNESDAAITARVFAAFRRRMWPILGQTTVDVLRVVDWAIDTLGVAPAVRIGGLSMGGDIAVAAASIEPRIERAVAVVATPEWTRPGMHDVEHRERLVDQGVADAYAQHWYDALDPARHLERFARAPDIRFLLGGHDNHVPPSNAIDFKAALGAVDPAASARVTIELIPGLAHLDTRDPARWWPRCLELMCGDESRPTVRPRP